MDRSYVQADLYNAGVSLVSTRWLSKLAAVPLRSTLVQNLSTFLIDVPFLLLANVFNRAFSFSSQ